MKKHNDKSKPLSYESDGKMGKSKEQMNPKEDHNEFFNVTQESE